jgi:hypothetical protein
MHGIRPKLIALLRSSVQGAAVIAAALVAAQSSTSTSNVAATWISCCVQQFQASAAICMI